MSVTIKSQHQSVVNKKNAIALLTGHQKYYGENFYISAAILPGRV